MIAGWLPLCQAEDLHDGPVYLDDPYDCNVKIVCTMTIVNGNEVTHVDQIGCDDDYWDDTAMTCTSIPHGCPMWYWEGRHIHVVHLITRGSLAPPSHMLCFSQLPLLDTAAEWIQIF